MKLQEFLEQSAGKWFAQRTSYSLEQDKLENSKSELTVEVLSPDCPEAIAICQNAQEDQSRNLGGMKTRWDPTEPGKPQQNATVLIFVADHNSEQAGKLLYTLGSKFVAGRYSLGDNDALTLSTREGTAFFEERLWFASPNLRLRTSLFQPENNISTTSFYSEIRKLPPKQE